MSITPRQESSEGLNVAADAATARTFESRRQRWRWQIFGITWLAYAGFYLTRKSFAVAKIEMGAVSGPGLALDQMAWMDGAFLTAYAVGQFLSGMCGDYFGPRRVILVGMLGSVVAAMAMGASSLVPMMGFFFCLQGLCQSAGWAPLTKNVGSFFARKERGTVLGLWCTNYAAGGFVASLFAGYFGSRWGWRWAFFMPAVALLGIWVLFYLLQRDRPEDIGLPAVEDPPASGPGGAAMNPDNPTGSTGNLATALEVLKSPMVLLLAAVYFLLKPARYAILFWAPKYLNEKLGTGMAESGVLSSLFELAGPLSVLAAGVLSDRLFKTRRNPVIIISLLLLSVLLFSLDRLPPSRLMLGGCLFLIGFLLFGPDSLISSTSPVDFGAQRGASTAVGLISGCGSVGAIVGGTIPVFFHARWGWRGVFTVLAISVFIAGAILLPKWNALPVSARNPERRRH